VGTPFDLGRLLAVRHPVIRVRYEIEEVGLPVFGDILGSL